MDEQADQIYAMTDPIAERVRNRRFYAAFGHIARNVIVAGANVASRAYSRTGVSVGNRSSAPRASGRAFSRTATPRRPSKRRDILAAAVEGFSVNNTVVLGPVWDAKTSAPDGKENLVVENAMAPQHLRVPAGTTVTLRAAKTLCWKILH